MRGEKMKVIAIVLCLCLSGCGVFVSSTKKSSKLSNLNVGMSKEEVRNMLGKPDQTLGKGKWAKDSPCEVSEYFLYSTAAGLVAFFYGLGGLTIAWWIPCHWVLSDDKVPGIGRPYWIHFVNGKVAFWGEKNDLNDAPKEVMDCMGKSW